MNTFGQLKASRIADVIGMCPTSSEFKDIVNEAMERLANRGNWKGSYQRVRFCLDNGCITLPRQIESLIEISQCSDPVPVRNQWYEFVSDVSGFIPNSDCNCQRNLIDRGYYPTFADLKPPNKEIRLYYTNSSDIGKRVLLLGNDQNEIWIRSLEDGVYIDGTWYTLASPFTQTTFAYTALTGIQKEETAGDVLVYEVDTVTSVERLLARMQPTETVAYYHRYYFNGLDSACTTSGTKTVLALAKLRFIPVSQDSDFLYIPNIPAIKDMVRSIYFDEKDTAESQAQAIRFERKAIAELNHQKQTASPKDQITIRSNVYGSAVLSKKNIGRLT